MGFVKQRAQGCSKAGITGLACDCTAPSSPEARLAYWGACLPHSVCRKLAADACNNNYSVNFGTPTCWSLGACTPAAGRFVAPLEPLTLVLIEQLQ